MRKYCFAALVFLFFVASALGQACPAFAADPIPVGAAPYTVLADPVAHEVYVANMFSDNVTVIDSVNDTVTATITVGPPAGGGMSAPVALAHNPNTGRLYCANFWSGQLLTIDMATKSVENTITIGGSHVNPRAVVANPSTDLIYFSTLGQSRVYAVEGDTVDPNYNSIVATITVGSYPRSLAVNATVGRLYVANTSGGTVSVIDIDPGSGTFHQVVGTIAVGSEPYALALNYSSGKLYVTNRAGGTVTVIDTATDSRVATVTVGAHPRSADVNPEANLVYVSNRDSDTVSVIDGQSDTVTRTVSAGSRPYAVACVKTLNGNTYVANYGTPPDSGTVTGIDSSFNTSDTTVGLGPASLSIDTLLAKAKVFVGNYASGNVSVIDPPGGESSLLTTIDPLLGDRTGTATPTITGSSTSVADPHPRAIIGVYYLLDSTDGRWRKAEITGGAGTASVTWRVAVADPLTPGAHTIRIFAMDVTGATVTSSDGMAANTPCTGQVAAYAFDYETSTPGSIGGLVHNDANANGLRDSGETAMVGKSVLLIGPAGSLAVTRTAADGRYAFRNLAPGDYTVRCPFSTRWRMTTRASVPIALASGQDAAVDFGALRHGWIWGRVTGLRARQGYAGVLIKLWPAGRRARTSRGGWYGFGRLVPSGTALMPRASYLVTVFPPRGYRVYGGVRRLATVRQGAGTLVSFKIYRQRTAR